MARTSTLIILFLLFSRIVFSQSDNRYMVFFNDKAGSPFSKSDSLSFLSQKAIDRRLAQGLFIEDKDIPVNSAYVQSVHALGIDTFFKSRWLNGVLVQCNASDIAAIQALSFVNRVELVAPGSRLSLDGRKRYKTRGKKLLDTESTLTQRQMIGLDYMHKLNIAGQGKTIAVFDSGFPGVNTTAPFELLIGEGRLDLESSYDFVHNTTEVFQYDNHGTQVLSVMTAFTENMFVGGAYKADYQVYVTEDVDSEYRIEEYNWLFAAEHADSAGVDIIHSSLGYYDFDDASMNYSKSQLDGATTVITRAAQWAADRGIVVVCSAGNEGTLAWETLTAPADARDVIAVANVTSSGVKAPTSSVGPSADNRTKPDVGALGQNVSVILENGMQSSASGTSVSSPLITSLVAGVWQKYPGLTNREVIDLIRKTSSQANHPDNLIGYGIPNFRAIVNFQEQIDQKKPFIVYPNPVLDTINIRPVDPDSIPSCDFELINAQGQRVVSGIIAFDWLHRTYQEDISSLHPGLYFLNITSGNRRFTFKVIKR